MVRAILVGWPGLIEKCHSICPRVIPLVSDRSVWHNGQRPQFQLSNVLWSLDFSNYVREQRPVQNIGRFQKLRPLMPLTFLQASER